MQTMSMTLLYLFVIPITTGLRKSWDSDNFSAGERIMKIILKSCHEHGRSSDPVVIFGDFNEFVDELSVIKMNKHLNVREGHERNKFYNSQPNKIVFIENSPEQLELDLILFKKTMWWNHMAPFFIIGKNSQKCRDFEDMLMTTWKMDIINSIYICSESRNTTALYTLNPITNYAPHPWKRVDMPDKIHIFRQVFDANVFCKNLNYDKTKFLNGYVITAAFWGHRNAKFFQSNHLTELPSSRLLHSVSNALNVSLMFKETKSPLSLMEYFDSGSPDLLSAPYSLEFLPDHSFLFPHKRGELIAVVKSVEMSTLQKILRLWNIQVLLLASIALIILFSVLAIINNSLISGVMDIIRFLTFVSIYTKNRNHSFRIYFTTMLILIVISNGVFQGKIAAFLTKPERLPIAKDISELRDLEYKFYAESLGSIVMEDMYPEYGTSAETIAKCIGHVLNDTLSACILPLGFYEVRYNVFPLEHVAEPVLISLWNLKCRHNWPLHNRVNYMVMRIFESGLPTFWEQKESYLPTHKRHNVDMEFNRTQYRPVKLVKLDFALELLVIGLSFAAIVFFLELVIAKF